MRILITGAAGQDGSLLAERCLADGHEVIACVRRSTADESRNVSLIRARAESSASKLSIVQLDVSSPIEIDRVIEAVRPSAIFNLAAQSHVGQSFAAPEQTLAVNAVGAVALLESAQRWVPRATVYQASTSEMFGGTHGVAALRSNSPMDPRSPYAASKLLAHSIAKQRRECGQRVFCGILFNHESERRGRTFVTRKITSTLARIKLGFERSLTLGSLHPRRDWGYAPEYVEAMLRIIDLPEPCDFVLGTGVSHSVGEFLDLALEVAGLDRSVVRWDDAAQVRPLDVADLVADTSEAAQLLGWRAQTQLPKLVQLMVEHDMSCERNER